MSEATEAAPTVPEFQTRYELEQYFEKLNREWEPPKRRPVPAPVTHEPHVPFRLKYDDLKTGDGFWKAYDCMLPNDVTEADLLNPDCWSNVHAQLSYGAEITCKTKNLAKKWVLEVTNISDKPRRLTVRVVERSDRRPIAPKESKAPHGYLILEMCPGEFRLVKRVDGVDVDMAKPFKTESDAFSFAMGLAKAGSQ